MHSPEMSRQKSPGPCCLPNSFCFLKRRHLNPTEIVSCRVPPGEIPDKSPFFIPEGTVGRPEICLIPQRIQPATSHGDFLMPGGIERVILQAIVLGVPAVGRKRARPRGSFASPAKKQGVCGGTRTLRFAGWRAAFGNCPGRINSI